MLKNYLKSYVYLFSIVTILTFILSIINYFINLNSSIFKLIIPIIALFISNIILGKNSKKKGYVEGIKFSLIFIAFSMLLKLLLKSQINFSIVCFYALFILVSVIGAMIGINMKKIN